MAAERVKRELGFECGFYVDCMDPRGGLMLLWNEDWDVRIQSFSRFHIDCFICGGPSGDWRFTGFYGNPARNERHHSWTLLERVM